MPVHTHDWDEKRFCVVGCKCHFIVYEDLFIYQDAKSVKILADVQKKKTQQPHTS